ncbi:uncharacterized protein LOC131937247 isoform X2 [Physella acuta]|nr:uncharacterized protein LOC131937247 isoform X2 [Physella acuta]
MSHFWIHLFSSIVVMRLKHNAERMELPVEVIELILLNVGGKAFVNFSRTCRQHLDIANELHNRAKPTIWRRFVFEDYTLACVESVAPWLYSGDPNDPALWKTLYIQLHRTSLLLEGRPCVARKDVYHQKVQLVHDLKFCYGYLFLLASPNLVNLIGLAGTLISEHDCTSHAQSHVILVRTDCGTVSLTNIDNEDSTIAKLEQIYRRWNHTYLKGTYISCWTGLCIIYRQDVLCAELNFYTYSGTGFTPVKCVRLEKSLKGLLSLAFNQQRVAAVCSNKMLCLFPHKASAEAPVYQQELHKTPVKIKMVADLIIILFDDGSVETGQVVSQDGCMCVPCWEQLSLEDEADRHDKLGWLAFNVKDFVLLGHLFAVISDFGYIMVSYLDSLSHKSLARNLRPVCSLPLREGGVVSRLTLDQHHGVKLAVLEKFFDGISW